MRNGNIDAMTQVKIGAITVGIAVVCTFLIAGLAASMYEFMQEPNRPAVATPAPVAVPTLPETEADPPFAVVDYEDMAGLDAETQAMLAQNEQGGRETDRRLRAIEANLDALNHRVFGPRVRPGAIGEMGAEFDAGPSILGSDGPDAQ